MGDGGKGKGSGVWRVGIAEIGVGGWGGRKGWRDGGVEGGRGGGGVDYSVFGGGRGEMEMRGMY